MNDLDTGILGMGTIAVVVLFALVLLLWFVPVRLWIAAWSSGAYVGLVTLIGMRLRRVPPSTVVTARISAVKAGLSISPERAARPGHAAPRDRADGHPRSASLARSVRRLIGHIAGAQYDKRR